MSDRERQISYDFTYMKNFKQTNKKTQKQPQNTENRLVAAIREGSGQMGETGERETNFENVWYLDLSNGYMSVYMSRFF